MAQVASEQAADKEIHVGADAVLLINHAEADSGIPPLQIGHHFAQRASLRLDLRLPEVLFMSKIVWDKLGKEQQEALRKAKAGESAAASWYSRSAPSKSCWVMSGSARRIWV